MKTNKKPQFPKIFSFSFSFFSLNSCSPPLSFFLSAVAGPGCLAQASFPLPLSTALFFFRSCRQCRAAFKAFWFWLDIVGNVFWLMSFSLQVYNTNTITNNFGFVKRSGPCFFSFSFLFFFLFIFILFFYGYRCKGNRICFKFFFGWVLVGSWLGWACVFNF